MHNPNKNAQMFHLISQAKTKRNKTANRKFHNAFGLFNSVKHFEQCPCDLKQTKGMFVLIESVKHSNTHTHKQSVTHIHTRAHTHTPMLMHRAKEFEKSIISKLQNSYIHFQLFMVKRQTALVCECERERRSWRERAAHKYVNERRGETANG